MDDDSFNQGPPQADGWVEGSDGWVTPSEATVDESDFYESVEPAEMPASRPPDRLPVRANDTTPSRSQADSVEDGKALALLSHASLLFGIPVFIIPMIQKDNAFALHHSKAAAVNFVMFTIAVTITVITCGLAFPLIFLCYIPAIVGVVHAANGELAGPWGWGGLGERIFSGLQAPEPEEPRQLEEW